MHQNLIEVQEVWWGLIAGVFSSRISGKAKAPGWSYEHLIFVPDTEGHGSSSSLGYRDGYPYLHFKMHYFMAVEEKETATKS